MTTYGIGIPVTIVNLIVISVGSDLPTCKGCKPHRSVIVGRGAHTGCSIDDQQDGGHEREEEDSRREDGSSGPTLNHWCDEDGTDTLSGLVNTLGGTHWMIEPLVG